MQLGRLGVERRGEAVEAGVAPQPQRVNDPLGLAIVVQRRNGEAAIGPEQDANPGPAGPDPTDDALGLVYGSGRGIDVGAAQLGGEQVAAAEDIERQIVLAPIGSDREHNV